jgi:acetyltransferase
VTSPPASPPAPPEALRGRYPNELERTWQPAGASAVTIRPLRADDLALERRFIESLSPQTLYQRVQYFATSASERDLARLLDLDYYDRLAVGGVTHAVAGETLVGVSRYARIAGTRRAECAIVVADGWQGRGLGSELMRTLGIAARARDIDWLEGSTLAENARIANWGRRFGFPVHTEPNSGGLVVVRIDLQDLARSGG